MTKAQARRLALWANGRYMLHADHTGLEGGAIDDDQMNKIAEAQERVAISMIVQSGIPASATDEEALAMVLANRRVDPREEEN